MSPDTPLLFDDDEELYEGPPPVELPPTMPEFPLFEAFANATLHKRQLERELKTTNAELTRLTPLLLNFFAAYPQWDNVGVSGLTIHQKSQIWARPMAGYSKPDVCRVLRACGLGHFVKDDYNTNSLSGHIRGLEAKYKDELADGSINDISEILPPALAKVLNVEPKISIVGLRSKKLKS